MCSVWCFFSSKSVLKMLMWHVSFMSYLKIWHSVRMFLVVFSSSEFSFLMTFSCPTVYELTFHNFFYFRHDKLSYTPTRYSPLYPFTKKVLHWKLKLSSKILTHSFTYLWNHMAIKFNQTWHKASKMCFRGK